MKNDKIFTMQKKVASYFIKLDPRIWASFISLLISLIMASKFFINNDGIFYVRAAEDFLANGLAATHSGLRWPFYPLLIAGLSYVTHVPLVTSALIWQALLQILLVISFISVIRLLGGNKTIQVIAAVIILLQPTLTEYRDSIIRDFGYWAFLITAFYYLLSYATNTSWKNLLGWTLSIGLATLFRIEGSVIIMLAPLLLLLSPHGTWKSQLKKIIYLYCPWIIVALLLSAFLIISKQDLSKLGRLADLNFWLHFMTSTFFLEWENMQEKLATLMHADFGAYENAFLIGGLVGYIVALLLDVLKLVFAAVIAYGIWQRCLNKYVSISYRHLLYGFLFINLLIPAIFVTHYWFLLGRFVTPAALVLLLWIPFTLPELYKRWQATSCAARFPRLLPLVLIIFSIVLLREGMISFGPSSYIVKEGADWVKINTPTTAIIYTNSPQMAYYSERKGSDDQGLGRTLPLTEVLSSSGNWKNYNYLALYMKRKDKNAQQLVAEYLPFPALATFENRHGDQVRIYEVPK
jgi:4-amino-4-deoxy-L-arabinose transferase-like glycosyltransferase